MRGPAPLSAVLEKAGNRVENRAQMAILTTGFALKLMICRLPLTRLRPLILGVASAVLAVMAGCSRTENAPAPASDTAAIPPATTSKQGAQPATQKVNPPLTPNRSLGIELTKMLTKDPRLVGAAISVGTDTTTITLDGRVPTPSAKQLASQIVEKKAPTFKVLNRLVVATGNST